MNCHWILTLAKFSRYQRPSHRLCVQPGATITQQSLNLSSWKNLLHKGFGDLHSYTYVFVVDFDITKDDVYRSSQPFMQWRDVVMHWIQRTNVISSLDSLCVWMPWMYKPVMTNIIFFYPIRESKMRISTFFDTSRVYVFAVFCVSIPFGSIWHARTFIPR